MSNEQAKLQAAPQLPEPPPTLTRINPQGLIEIIDLTNGKILCIERTPTDRYLKKKFEELTIIDTPQGRVYLDKSIDPASILIKDQPAYALSWVELLANDIINGLGLPKACAAHNLPYGLVKRWERLYPEAKALLEQARQDRAEQRAEKSLQIAEAATSESVKADKLKIDTLQWAAEKDDPERYGKKEKIEQTSTATTTFIIQTGVPRDVTPNPDFAEAIAAATPQEQGPDRVMEIEGESYDDEGTLPGPENKPETGRVDDLDSADGGARADDGGADDTGTSDAEV